VVARRVRPGPFRLAASPAYLKRHAAPSTPEDLSRLDFVTAGGPDSLSLDSPQGPIEIPLRVALRCKTVADVAMTVAGGVGIAIVPAALWDDPVFANLLTPVLTEFPLKESTLYLVYPDRQYVSFKTRAFIDLVLESGARSRQPAPPRMPPSRRRILVERQPVAALAC
jgi:DNA-binding transcriptional LysR family regulator